MSAAYQKIAVQFEVGQWYGDYGTGRHSMGSSDCGGTDFGKTDVSKCDIYPQHWCGKIRTVDWDVRPKCPQRLNVETRAEMYECINILAPE